MARKRLPELEPVITSDDRSVMGWARVIDTSGKQARGEDLSATHYWEDGKWHPKHDVFGGPHDSPPTGWVLERRPDLDTMSQLAYADGHGMVLLMKDKHPEAEPVAQIRIPRIVADGCELEP